MLTLGRDVTTMACETLKSKRGLNMPVDLTTIVTSAAIGGVVGSAISFFGQILERKSRRKELLLAKSVELAIDRARFVYQAAEKQDVEADISDPAINCATYFRWLKYLLDKGELPPDAIAKRNKK
jgi:hypothetical protein